MQSEAEIWAAREFGGATLGDARRTARLIRLAAAVANSPGGRVTSVLSDAAEREAAYRFVENRDVSASAIGAAVFGACAERCAQYERTVVGVDQSTVSIMDRLGTKGLARTGSHFALGGRRGFEVMSAVAVGTDGSTVGLLGQAWHLRPEERSPLEREDTRPYEERESGLWLRCMRAAMDAMKQGAPTTRAWFQLDRGGDINHVLQAAATLDADFTVRASHNRRLETGGHLHSALRKSRLRGQLETTVIDSHAPAGVTRARRVTLALRARRVTLRLQHTTGRAYGSLDITVVHARETGRGRRSRIEWYLLTNVEVSSIADAWGVVQAYRGRWRVEEFHRAWKSGVCDVEVSQLRSAPAFRRWATILAAVAARSERLKTIARAEPERPALTEFTRDELDAAILLRRDRKLAVGAELTLKQAVELVALVGGYTGRRNSGGPPGATVIARGLHDVVVAARALAASRERSGQ